MFELAIDLIIITTGILILLASFQKNERFISDFLSFFMLLIIIMITIIIGFRPVDVGADTWVYSARYDIAVNEGLPLFDFIIETKYQPLFNTVTWFFSINGIDTSYYLLFISCMISLLIIWFATKTISAKYLSIFILLLISFPFFYSISGNVIRAGLSIAFIFLSLEGYYKNNLNRYWILGVIAFLFHDTGMLFLSPFIISFLRINVKRAFVIWFSCIHIGHFFDFSPFIIELEMDIISKASRYVQSGNNNTFRFDFLFFSSIPIMLYFILSKFKSISLGISNRFRFYFVNYLLLNSVYNIFSSAAFSDRFALTSWLLIPFLIVYALDPKNDKYLIPPIVVFSILFFIFYPNRFFLHLS